MENFIRLLKASIPCDLHNSHSLHASLNDCADDFEMGMYKDEKQNNLVDECSSLLKSIQDYLPVTNLKNNITQLLADRSLSLECLWLISAHSLANLQQYLLVNSENEIIVGTFTENLIALLDAESLNEFQSKVLSDLVTWLVMIKFSPQTSAAEENTRRLYTVTEMILDSLSKKIFSLLNEDGNQRICIHQLVAQNRAIDFQTLRKYYTSQILYFLKNNQEDKLSLFQVVSLQNRWRYNDSSPTLRSEIFQLLSPFSANEIGGLIREIVEQPNVNWKLLLTFISHFLVLYCDGSSILRDIANNFICEALTNGNEDNIIISIILARQADNVGIKPHVSYSDWFQQLFTMPVIKKTSAFLLKIFSDLVPFDPTTCLKIQMTSGPHMPKKCRALHKEYTSLATTRLLDIKESADKSSNNPHSLDDDDENAERKLTQQAIDDVDKMIALYEINGKIPPACVELSLFRKPYFLSRFLPALLKCSETVEATDSKSKFIHLLHRSGKIPTSMYKEYELACAKYRSSQLKRRYLHDSPAASIDLQELFAEYSRAVTDEIDSGIIAGSKNIISEISRQLLSTFGSDLRTLNEPVIFNPSQLPVISEQSANVINLLLRAFGATMCSVAKVNCTDETWAKNLISACLAYNNLHEALYYRLWELIIVMGSNLTLQHKWTLSVFLVHLRPICGRVLIIDNEQNYDNIVDIIIDAIPCETPTEMLLCFTIISFYLQHTFLSFSISECQQRYIPLPLIAKFSRVSQLYPEIEDDKIDTSCPPLIRILYSSKQYKMIVAKSGEQKE